MAGAFVTTIAVNTMPCESYARCSDASGNGRAAMTRYWIRAYVIAK